MGTTQWQVLRLGFLELFGTCHTGLVVLGRYWSRALLIASAIDPYRLNCFLSTSPALAIGSTLRLVESVVSSARFCAPTRTSRAPHRYHLIPLRNTAGDVRPRDLLRPYNNPLAEPAHGQSRWTAGVLSQKLASLRSRPARQYALASGRWP